MLVLQPVPIAPIVDQAVAHAKPIGEARQVTFSQHIAAHTVVAHADSISQLLGILLDNAIKYGRQSGEVRVTGHKQGQQYVVRVIDQGPGISEDDLPHIFERLYRGDKARTTRAGGYGLGLALAKQIAEANGAELSAYNNKKGGACFELRLEIGK